MSRHRSTWNNRAASAPPATPGYDEPSNHPAAYPDPAANAYENGDTSSWAEDPHPGPYPNSAPPADPGMDEPQGHPATDLAHYFPNGVGKQAARDVRAAAEQKADKCIQIATRMLGKKASVDAIESQALDLMVLTNRQIAASLARMGSEVGANYTLTPPRKADDDGDADDLLAEMLEEDEGKKASDLKLDKLAAAVAKKLAAMPGGQNSPEHYNFRADGVLASKKSEDEDEDKLAAMIEDEAKKASAKKSEEKVEEPAKDEKKSEEKAPEEEPKEAAKKAAYYKRLASDWAKKAAEEDDAAAKDEKKADEPAKEETSEKKAALKRLATLEMPDEVRTALEGVLGAKIPAFMAAADDDAVDPEGDMMADFMDDDMVDDMGLDDPMDENLDESLAMLYGMKQAKDEAEPEAAKEEEETKDEPVKKTAGVRPQPRKASAGIKTLSNVVKAESGGVNDLSKLWASSPDVSEVFGK